jgi:hypothetical protein
MKGRDHFPLGSLADLHAGVRAGIEANNLMPAASVENLAVPSKYANAAPGSNSPQP